jgi:hypothetical protein
MSVHEGIGWAVVNEIFSPWRHTLTNAIRADGASTLARPPAFMTIAPQ